MRQPDVAAVTMLHRQAFPSFFLTFLGPAFLRLLYGALAEDPEGVALVWEAAGEIRGFAAGVLRQRGFYRRLLRRRLPAFAWASLGAVLRRPSIAPRLWRALRRPAEAAESAAEACLMSIAVDPGWARKGIGRQLALAFCDALTRRGAPAVCLTTDRIDNDPANRFYAGLGFRLARAFVTPEGRAMNEYVLALK